MTTIFCEIAEAPLELKLAVTVTKSVATSRDLAVLDDVADSGDAQLISQALHWFHTAAQLYNPEHLDMLARLASQLSLHVRMARTLQPQGDVK